MTEKKPNSNLKTAKMKSFRLHYRSGVCIQFDNIKSLTLKLLEQSLIMLNLIRQTDDTELHRHRESKFNSVIQQSNVCANI
jgi:hypothetical protein